MRLIVVIDNNGQFVKKITRDLSGMRHRILGVTSGARGVEMARTGNPDLILLDLYLEGMTSFQVIQELKADEITKDIPIILTSPELDKEILLRAKKLGIVDCLMKPYTAATLQEKVQKGLSFSDKRFQKNKEENDPNSGFQFKSADGKLLVTFQEKLGVDESEKLLIKMRSFLTNLKRDIVIMDIRALPELNANDALILLNTARELGDTETLIVAGRNYGPLIALDRGSNTKLFLSREEILRYFKFKKDTKVR